MDGGRDKERWRLYGRSVKMESKKTGGEGGEDERSGMIAAEAGTRDPDVK